MYVDYGANYLRFKIGTCVAVYGEIGEGVKCGAGYCSLHFAGAKYSALVYPASNRVLRLTSSREFAA